MDCNFYETLFFISVFKNDFSDWRKYALKKGIKLILKQLFRFQIGKGVHRGCIFSPCLFNLYAEYIVRNAGLEEAQAGIKIAGRNINNHRYADDTTLMAESEEELKSLLMNMKEKSEKFGLKVNIQETKIMASGPITSWQTDGETVANFFWAPKSLQMVTAAMKLKDAYSLEGKLWSHRKHIKKQRHYFVNKSPSGQGYGFSSGHVLMWELDYKESWVLKNWCFWTVVLENTLESPLDCKEIQPIHPKGNQSWEFIGRTDIEAETPILWSPDTKNWLSGKDPDSGKDRRWEEKGITEDEMAGWHHRLNERDFG